ncbi:MAG: hypothetical protein ACRD2R_00290 [Terriglobales bacterium]
MEMAILQDAFANLMILAQPNQLKMVSKFRVEAIPCSVSLIMTWPPAAKLPAKAKSTVKLIKVKELRGYRHYLVPLPEQKRSLCCIALSRSYSSVALG